MKKNTDASSAQRPRGRSCAWLFAFVAQAAFAASPGAPRAAAQPLAATPPQSTTEAAAGAQVAAAAGIPPPVSTRGLPAQLAAAPARIGPEMTLMIGKSTLLRLPDSIDRVSVGNPGIADVTPVSDRELYLLGKDLGTTNMIIWAKGGQATVIDVKVTADPSLLEAELSMLLPGEREIRVKSSADSLVLVGSVSDSIKAAHAVQIAEAWVRRLTRPLLLPVSTGSGTSIQVGTGRSPTQTAQLTAPRVINMLRVRSPMQVMLEVKVAEISKTLLNRLGVTTVLHGQSGRTTFDIVSQSNFLNQLLGTATIAGARNAVQLDAQRNDGLIKLLAEPNIMAISGQEASFRAGGKIFIPVARRADVTGIATLTLEEKEFGVGLKFKPTVLEDGRINLQVAPEVSELQQAGTPFTTVNGAVSVLPSFTLRRAETTVQLNDGQSFMIAGLIQSNAAETINRFPGLGDIPILGALFRSTEFQNEKTELMFVITPRLVKPLPQQYALPTDAFTPPNAAELLLQGRMEGAPRADQPGGPAGFETE